jgi:hypothetical protein
MDAPVTESTPHHEQSSLNIRPIVLFGLGLLVLSIVTFVSMGWLFDYFVARQAKLDVPPLPLANPQQLPPEPRLQVDPVRDLQRMRAAEDVMLNSYRWIDREARIVGIPIDRAIEVLAEKGLPVRPDQD